MPQMNLEPPKTTLDAIRNLEIAIQAFYFINLVNKDRCPDGKLDRARAIIHNYLNQFPWTLDNRIDWMKMARGAIR